MKRILLCIIGTVIAILTWGGTVFLGTLNGWFHKPLARRTPPDAFMKAAEKEVRKQFTGSFAMATLKGGVVEYENFYSAGPPVDRYTVFQVSSLSKWVSAFGIMKLVEDGRLDPDAPVSRYLTRWKLPDSPYNNGVTVRRLLSHTAGLTDGLGYSGFEAGVPVPSLEESLTHAADADAGVDGSVHVGLEPGTTFKYSGGGYTLLQLLVEEVTGQSFNDYMRAAVFEPLQMVHSSYVWGENSPYSLTEFYNADGTKAKHYRYASLAATSLYTSLSDLELFFQAHLPGDNKPAGRNVIKAETVKLMRQPHAQQMGYDIWGLGTMLYAPTEQGSFIIGHDGKSTPPINTAVRLNPETGDGIIVLETGAPLLATRLASEWVFWKTGMVDSLLFTMLMRQMILIMAAGWLAIIGASVFYGITRGSE